MGHRAWLLVLAACSSPAARPANRPSPSTAVIDPTDAELGLLAIVPVAAHTPGSWIPVLDPRDRIAAFLPEPWAGPAYGDSRYPPAPVVTDARGAKRTGTYGQTMLRDYGCGRPHGLVPIHTTGAFQPGVAWLLPGTTTWSPAPVEIRTTTSTSSHREHTLGPVAIEVLRTTEAHAVTTYTWRGRKVLTLELERAEDESEPLDLLDASQTPQLEAAWSIGGAMLIVTREHHGSYRTTFRAVVVNPVTGREASGMISVLCYAT